MRETKTVTVALEEIVANYVEDLHDVLNERGWPQTSLSGITYRAVGVSVDGTQIVLEVTAEPVPVP